MGVDQGLLADVIRTAAQSHGQREAIVADGQRWSYATLFHQAQRLAAQLQASGVGKGDRVLIWLDNGLPMVVALWGTLLAGAVIVPVHASTKCERLRFVLQDAEPVAVVTSAAVQSLVEQACEGMTRSVRVCTAEWQDEPGEGLVWHGLDQAGSASAGAQEVMPIALVPGDMAALIYTSGTTAHPKGVILTHANMRAASRSIQAYLGLRASDRILCALPMCFSYGLYHLFLAAAVGACLHVEKAFSFPVKMVELMVRERISVWPAVPTMYAMLLSLKATREADWHNLRLMTNAGSALPTEHLKQISELWPQVQFVSMYGLTECARVSYLPPDDLPHRPNSVGRGMPHQRCWLVNEQGQAIPAGEVGELVVQGEHVMQGYWKQAQASEQRLPPWGEAGSKVLRTGDLFWADADGYMYFVGRQDDIIKSRGEKVSPREVEEVLHRLPGAWQVAVTGVPDITLGQAVHAHVVLAPGACLTERDVIRFCLAHLENFKAPQVVHFVAELPLTESGKVLKRQLIAAPSLPISTATTTS